MQWLVDLVIAAIGIPPVFVDRGDPPFPDWTEITLPARSVEAPLDLSGIIDEGAVCVAFSLVTFNANVGEHITLQGTNIASSNNLSFMNTMTAMVVQGDFLLAYPDDAGIIVYWIDAGGWLSINLTVRGWWMGR